ncbi:MAG: TonB-dependent receptor [Candidatus Eisenbacteria bacterium]|nr:TonB-dependent receptor [Candidatus Eisenbacteria bacterium]
MSIRAIARPAAWAPSGQWIARVLIASAALLAAAVSAYAEPSAQAAQAEQSTEPEPVYGPVDTIRVEGAPWTVETEALRLPYSSETRGVDAGTERLITLADVLEEAAGVRVRRYGGLGSYAVATIRGGSPGQVEVYLDGVPLNSAQWGATDLAELPIGDLARVEVYRSGAPARFGVAGVGGVVNLVTRPAGPARSLLSLSGGSYSTWKTSALRSGSYGGAGYLIAYHHMQSRGDFSFLYDPGTSVANTEDDTTMTRENNAFREHAVLFKAEAPPVRGWRLSMQDDWFLKRSGNPGHGNLLYEEASFDGLSHRASLSALSPRFAGGRLRADLTAHARRRRDRWRNPGAEPTLHLSDYEHRMEGEGARGMLTGYWTEARHVIRLGAEIGRESFMPVDSDPRIGEGFRRERRSLALAAEREIVLWGGRFVWLDAYRYRETRDNYHGTNPYHPDPSALEEPHWTAWHGPTFGATLRPARGLALRANRAAASRAPTLFELFGTSAQGSMSDVNPNPSLVPEESVTWETGIRMERRRGGTWNGSIDLTAYRATRDSLIYFVQNAQGNFTAKNLERSVAEGIEARFDADLLRALYLEGSFTVQDARHTGDVPHWNGKRLPYVSPRELFLRASARRGRVSFRYEYFWYDRYYTDRYNSEETRAGEKRLHNMGARLRLWKNRASLDIEVKNITNQTIADVYRYPMPGRSLYVTAEIDWTEGPL